ncbi:macro domain-containing protein [Candidatus Daviesbacteria bacterium]|nr:macro domain-containing protein [Candidatus Daviesbacteria bacterium]
MNIQICTDSIGDFTGDIIIIPCDSDLTYKKEGIVGKVLDRGGQDLVRELSAIGYCEIGNTAIVKGYNLQTKNIIFMPIYDHIQDVGTNYIGLHQSLRNAFILAELYEAKSVAIGSIKLPKIKKSIFEHLSDRLLGNKQHNSLDYSEIEDIIISISKDFEGSMIKNVAIYRYH